MISFDTVMLTKGQWRVILTYNGEGYCGDYTPQTDESDEKVDEPLVRYTIQRKGANGWDFARSGLTYIRATDSAKIIETAAQMILDELGSVDQISHELWQKFNNIHVVGKKVKFLPKIGSALADD